MQLIDTLCALAQSNEKQKRFALASALDLMMIKIAAKFRVSPKGNMWVADVSFQDKDEAKAAGFRWHPQYKVWYTDNKNIVDNLDPNVWGVEGAGHVESPQEQATEQTIIEESSNDLHIGINFDGFVYSIVGSGTYALKDILKQMKCFWNPAAKCWQTRNPEIASALSNSSALKEYLTKINAEEQELYAASAATTSEIELKGPKDKDYFPYQKAGIEFALKKANAIIGDEMGLGKTIQAIGVINNNPALKRILIISTASTKYNWEKEIHAWLVRPDLTVGVVKNGTAWVDTNIVIINYDLLIKFDEQIHSVMWDLVIADEAHKFKNPKAKKTEMMIGAYNKETYGRDRPIRARNKILLTGTPIANRPYELWTLLHFIDPKRWSSVTRFKNRYTIQKPVQTKKGVQMVVVGAQNLNELNKILRQEYMIRRTKSEVLKDLPPKTRQVIEMEINGQLSPQAQSIMDKVGITEVLDKLTKVAEDNPQYIKILEELNGKLNAAFEELAMVRHETGLMKAPTAANHVIDILEAEPGKKVIVFAHHQDVIEIIKNTIEEVFPNSVVTMTGKTSNEARERVKEEFQNNPDKLVFIGSIGAAREGITLTAASAVVFAELDWVPANMQQAEDRAHRIGQKDNVLIQYLTQKDSLDAHMAKLVAMKLRIIDQTLSFNQQDPAIPGASEQISKIDQQIQNIKDKKTSPFSNKEQMAIMLGIVYLAARNPDMTREINGIGFNKIDANFGLSLAQQIEDRGTLTDKQFAAAKHILTKYRNTQLPPEITRDIWPEATKQAKNALFMRYY